MKVAVIGSNGQLGTDLMAVLSEKHTTTGITHAQMDVTNQQQCREVLASIAPDVVINTAAFHNVPLCEKHVDRAFAVNATGALNISRICEEITAWHIYISTDYVFDGKKKTPYYEWDAPHPLNIYGLSKLAGEYATLNYCSRGVVVRVSGIYGRVPSRIKGTNFVYTMLKLGKEKGKVKVVDDEVLTPTATLAIARQINILLEALEPGIYHCTCQGWCSWYEFACALFKLAGMNNVVVEPCSATELSSEVKRPSYSVLENTHLKRLGIDHMPHWHEALAEFIRSLS